MRVGEIIYLIHLVCSIAHRGRGDSSFDRCITTAAGLQQLVPAPTQVTMKLGF